MLGHRCCCFYCYFYNNIEFIYIGFIEPANFFYLPFVIRMHFKCPQALSLFVCSMQNLFLLHLICVCDTVKYHNKCAMCGWTEVARFNRNGKFNFQSLWKLTSCICKQWKRQYTNWIAIIVNFKKIANFSNQQNISVSLYISRYTFKLHCKCRWRRCENKKF